MKFERIHSTLKRRSLYSSIFFFIFLSLLLHIVFILVSYFFLPMRLFHIRPFDEHRNDAIEVELEETPAQLTPFNIPAVQMDGMEEVVEAPKERENEEFQEQEEEIIEEKDLSNAYITPSTTVDLKKKALENLFKKKDSAPISSPDENKNETKLVKSMFIPTDEKNPEWGLSNSQVMGTREGNSDIMRNGDPSKTPTANDMKLSSYMRQLGMLFCNNIDPHLGNIAFDGIIRFYFEFDKKGALLTLGSQSSTSQKSLEHQIFKEFKSTFPVFSIPTFLNKEKVRGTFSIYVQNFRIIRELSLE